MFYKHFCFISCSGLNSGLSKYIGFGNGMKLDTIRDHVENKIKTQQNELT